jgi:outer membrane lipopolysaccharide assembly protein LptE/RlpB
MLAKQRLILLTCMTLAVISCGWQLRDMSPLANNLGKIYISYSDSQANIALALRRELNSSLVQLVNSSSEADYIIKVVDTRQSRRISAVNVNVRASQYQLYQTVDYSVTDPSGRQIIPLTTAYAERSHDFNEQDILAAENEESLIQERLRFDIVEQILNRIAETLLNAENLK